MALSMRSLITISTVLLIAGCDLNRPGGVAVIDLDRIASATGQAQTINEEVQRFAAEQETRLKTLQSELRRKLSDEEQSGTGTSAGPSTPSGESAAQARSQLARELEQARLSTQQLRQRLVREFTAEIQPVATAEAVSRGLSVVVVRQPGLLFVAPEVEITNAVISRLKSQPE